MIRRRLEMPTDTKVQNTQEMTVWQEMSRQTNYRTIRATERICQEWNELPLFRLLSTETQPGILQVAFVRRVQQQYDPRQTIETVPPVDDVPFNASMVTELELCPEELRELGKRLAESKASFKSYLDFLEATSAQRPSTRAAIRYFKQQLPHLPQLSGELAVIHHYCVELYRRLPYTRVLNSPIYPTLKLPQTRAFFFEARARPDQGGDILPDIVLLDPTQRGPTIQTQNFFRPYLTPRQKTTLTEQCQDPEALSRVLLDIHRIWFEFLELPPKDNPPDCFCVVLPVRENWLMEIPEGAYLGHLLIILNRSRFHFDALAEDNEPKQMYRIEREIGQDQAQSIWHKMSRFSDAAQRFLEVKPQTLHESDWLAKEEIKEKCDLTSASLGKMHWETMRRDLNRFAQICYESEFDDWLDIEFPPNAGQEAVRNALRSAAEHTDGWTPIDCPSPDCVRTNWESGLSTDYSDYFFPCGSCGCGGHSVLLKLKSETPDPGATPKQTLDFCLHADPDTIIPKDSNQRTAYFRRLYKRYNHFYQRLLRRAEIAAIGKQSGESKTFHDYSKDLNVLDDQLSRYASEAVDVRARVEVEAEGLLHSGSLSPGTAAALERIKREAARLATPKFDYILRLRFLMSHLRVKTEGRLYEAPEWCWKWVQSGTKRDIYLLVRALVWLPAGWSRFDEQRKTLPESARLDESFTWARLFLFDEDEGERSGTPPLRAAIDKALTKLFINWGIKQRDYAECFPPPQLNPEADWRKQLLWAALGEAKNEALRTLLPAHLLPLMVFALRTAFEHSYLRMLMRVRNAGSLRDLPRQTPRAIRLWDEVGTGHRIHVDFPAAGLESDLNKEPAADALTTELPYGHWSKHMNHYHRVAKPWCWHSRRIRGKLDPADADRWFYRITLEATQ